MRVTITARAQEVSARPVVVFQIILIPKQSGITTIPVAVHLQDQCITDHQATMHSQTVLIVHHLVAVAVVVVAEQELVAVVVAASVVRTDSE